MSTTHPLSSAARAEATATDRPAAPPGASRTRSRSRFRWRRWISPLALLVIGSHVDVADRVEEYHALGVDEFVLSGCPHLEEAYQVGDDVLPELARRGPLAGGRGRIPDAAVRSYASG